MRFVFAILILISKLPLKVLYIFSDIIYGLVYYLAGYRKNVVRENLTKSFPEKSITEIRLIQKNFYKNFSDYIVETLKSFTISETELRVRVQHINQEVFYEANAEGKNVIMLSGHIFNWEWYNALAKVVPQRNCYPVYRHMQSGFWDRKIKKIRNSFGNEALEDVEVIKHIFRNPNDGESVYMFVADQSPSEINEGIIFLNQETPVFVGYDKLATRMDLAFIFCEMKKVKRGFYQVNYYRIYPDEEKFLPNEVVKKFHKLLENTINKHPDNWLWSHRRWKYKDRIKKIIQ